MRKLLNIALNDLRIFFSTRGNLIGLVVVPVGLTLAIGYFFPANLFGAGAPRAIVDVVDLDQSALSAQLLADFRQSNQSLILCPLANTRDDQCGLDGEEVLTFEAARERLANEDSLVVILIPSGFGDRVRASEPTQLTFMTDPGSTASTFIRQSLDATLQRLNGSFLAAQIGSEFTARNGIAIPGLSVLVFQRAQDYWQQEPIKVVLRLSAEGESPASEGEEPPPIGFGQSVPGMATMYVMSTVLAGMTALIGERRRGTFQRVVMMPVTRPEFIGGKILGRFSLGMIQFLIVFAVGFLVGIRFGESLMAVLLVMFSYTLAVTAMAFALGTRMENESQASSLAQLLVLTLAPLGGAWWPLDIVPEFLQVLGHLSPVAWAMDAFHILIFETGDVARVFLSVTVLLGFSLVFFILGMRRFRYG